MKKKLIFLSIFISILIGYFIHNKIYPTIKKEEIKTNDFFLDNKVRFDDSSSCNKLDLSLDSLINLNVCKKEPKFKFFTDSMIFSNNINTIKLICEISTLNKKVKTLIFTNKGKLITKLFTEEVNDELFYCPIDLINSNLKFVLLVNKPINKIKYNLRGLNVFYQNNPEYINNKGKWLTTKDSCFYKDDIFKESITGFFIDNRFGVVALEYINESKKTQNLKRIY